MTSHLLDRALDVAVFPGFSRLGFALRGLDHESVPRFHRLIRPLLRDARQGADTIVWLATAQALEPATGGFWHDRAPRPEHRLPRTRETGAERKRFWAYCERLSRLAGRPLGPPTPIA